MIDSIHQSHLNMAFRCQEQFRLRYLENIIIPPGIGAARGTGCHKANHVNLTQKLKTKEDLSLGDLKDAARDGYVGALKDGVYLPKEDIGQKDKLVNEGLNDTLRLTALYKREVAPTITPIGVEMAFEANCGLSLPLAGTMDITEDGKIRDIKTTSKSWGNGQIAKEIQPVFYSFAYELETKERPKFQYDILIALKKQEKTQIQELTVSDRHYLALRHKLQAFLKMLETGTFLPANPSSWWCDPKWCGWYYMCKYVS